MIPNTTLKFQCFCLITLMLVAVSLVVFTCSEVVAYYNSRYTESAHGDSSSGVKRKAGESSADYGKGNCAHCHEQHASIGGSSHTAYDFALFAPNNPTSQTTNFCFQCHCDPASSKQSEMIENKDYGSTFGGGTAILTNIYDAFNASGSSHDLAAVQNYAKSTWGIDWMTDDTNACLVCHDPHYSQKNFPVEINAMGGVNTAVRRGNDVVTYPRNIWGDEPLATSGVSEMMSDWTPGYQAPYRVGETTHEPAGNSTQNGSNLPNSVTACAQTCHRKSVGGLANPINWLASSSATWPGTPDMHGRRLGDGTDYGNLKPPYTQAESYNYALSCTDCHEPHGSTNPQLLRTTVNGVTGLSVTGNQWYYWCQACHEVDTTIGTHGSEGIGPTTNCGAGGGCHYHGESALF